MLVDFPLGRLCFWFVLCWWLVGLVIFVLVWVVFVGVGCWVCDLLWLFNGLVFDCGRQVLGWVLYTGLLVLLFRLLHFDLFLACLRVLLCVCIFYFLVCF